MGRLRDEVSDGVDDDSGEAGGGNPVEGGGEAVEGDDDTDGGEDACERSANTTLGLRRGED